MEVANDEIELMVRDATRRDFWRHLRVLARSRQFLVLASLVIALFGVMAYVGLQWSPVVLWGSLLGAIVLGSLALPRLIRWRGHRIRFSERTVTWVAPRLVQELGWDSIASAVQAPQGLSISFDLSLLQGRAPR